MSLRIRFLCAALPLVQPSVYALDLATIPDGELDKWSEQAWRLAASLERTRPADVVDENYDLLAMMQVATRSLGGGA